MKYKDNEQPSLNGHGTGHPENPKHAAAPDTLPPSVLSRLGLTDRPMVGGDQIVADLRDEQSHVRVVAVRSLGEHKDLSTLQLLVSALHDPAWEVRVAALWALRAFGEHAPVDALIEALADEDGSVRAAALRVLVGVGGQVPPEQMERMLHDTDWLVHEAAALTAEELGEQAPTVRLVIKLDDEQTIVREATQISSHQQAHPYVRLTPPFTLESAMQTEVLGDRYQLQAPIGRGGMSTIYRGQDMHMNRVVAIKVLREAFSTDPKFVARFQREAKAASALHHPNIVEVYDYGQTNGNYYIVMELVKGTDLRRYLRSRGVLDVNRSVIIAHDVALGLAAAHRRGIVHRDIKPQNILVSHDGSIKLTDFGIVSVYQDINASRLTTTGMTLGTVQYYAPEQAQGEIVTPAADVYELGIVIYEMLTGRTPFDGDSPVVVAMQHIQDTPTPPGQFNPSIPVALEKIILRCLEKVPEMRFRDGSQLARALEKLGDAKLVPATSEHAPTLTTADHIASRPGDDWRDGTGEDIPPDPAASSPEHRMGSGIAPNSKDAGHVPGSLVKQPVYSNQQPFTPSPGFASSYRSQPGSISHSGVIRPRQRNSRFTRVMTILVTLATLLLLGFSIYVAAELGFINLPFINNGSSPTTASTIGTVPNLLGLDYQTALAQARHAGFNLRSQDNIVTGVVIQQVPPAGDMALEGSTITVEMGQLSPTITVPLHLVNNSLAAAEEILNAAHIPYTVQSAGRDPGKGPNVVTKVVPGEGSSLQPGQKVTLYVVNYTTATPSPPPTPTA